MNFSFIHAADLHLDSPLVGLGRKSAEYAERLDDASRRAFDNLIALAVEEKCRFMLIAGDVFDGQWRDYRTGLFFADRMRRLGDAGVAVFMILGNHDAENRFISRLELSENVRLLSHRKPESVPIDDLDVFIHGRSFPQRDVTENMALGYPKPISGQFNIGLLHTACTGRDGHVPYAPCTVEQLARHGYDYWALGHVHAREVLSIDPHIVFPGNLQGRNPRETGAKGATLVRVEGGQVSEVTHRPLDVVRWTVESVDVSAAENVDVVYGLVRTLIEKAYANADGRALALRLRLNGETALHHELVTAQTALREEIETVAAYVAGDLWIEKVELNTSPIRRDGVVDPTIAGKIRQAVEQLGRDASMTQRLESKLTELRTKMPAAAHIDELFAAIRAEVPTRALDLALALIERGRV